MTLRIKGRCSKMETWGLRFPCDELHATLLTIRAFAITPPYPNHSRNASTNVHSAWWRLASLLPLSSGSAAAESSSSPILPHGTAGTPGTPACDWPPLLPAAASPHHHVEERNLLLGHNLVSNTLGTAMGDFVATTTGFGFERGALAIPSSGATPPALPSQHTRA
jgi:hypothetical protein